MRQRFAKWTKSISEKLKKQKPVPNSGASSLLMPMGDDDPLPSTRPVQQSDQSQVVTETATSPIRADDDVWTLAFKKAQEREVDLMHAYEEYLLSLQSDNAGGGDLSVPEFITSIVKRAIEERDKKRWRVSLLGTPIEVKAQAERLIKFLLWSGSIVKVALNTQPYAALAWSAVSLLLPLVTSAITQNEAMLQGFNSIGDVQMYWQIYEKADCPSLSDSSPQAFMETLAKLYSFIIEYQARAICHLAAPRSDRAWNDMTNSGDWDRKIQEIHQLDDKCRAILHLTKDIQIEENWKQQLLEMQNLQTSLDVINNTLLESGVETRKIHEDQAEKYLLQSLASDYQGHKDFNPPKVKGTCEWFFADERFRDWRNSNASSLLLVSAGPGCGKSVLSRSLIDERRLSTNITTSTVCYFFFNDGDSTRMYAHNALCAILHQLFTHDPTGSLIAQALPSHKNFGEKLAENFSQLWGILIQCADLLKLGEIICVIDALDECQEDSRKIFVNKLQQFYQNPPVSSKLKFLITSRPYDTIEESFKKLSGATTYLRLDGDDKSADISHEINLVIDFRVNEVAQDIDENHRGLIAHQLKSMEHRTYLWLHLTLNIIEKNPSEYRRRIDVEALLSSLPLEVSEAYEKILARSKSRGYMEALLHIVLATTRPLTLIEANFALTLATTEHQFESHDTLYDRLWPLEIFKDYVKNLCGFFISVDGGTLSFIHQTAKEFLVHPQRQGQWQGRFNDVSKSHSIMSSICIKYLLLPDIAKVFGKGARVWRNTLLSYAAKSWPLHYRLQEAIEASSSLKDALALCCANEIWKPIHSRAGTRKHWTSLALASELGLEQVVQEILLQRADSVTEVNTALYKASSEGHREIIQVLLNNGADVNMYTDPWVNGTALQAASRFGHGEIVQMLLDSGADANKRGYLGGTPLQVAAERGYADIVQILLDKGAKVDMPGDYNSYNTALHAASEYGHGEVVQILLKSGAEVNRRGPGGTALQAASAAGRGEIVQMLLDNGADINTSGGHWITPLQAASARNHTGIVRMLREREEASM